MCLGRVVPELIVDEVGLSSTYNDPTKRLWINTRVNVIQVTYSALIHEQAVSSATTLRRQARLAWKKRLVRPGPLH